MEKSKVLIIEDEKIIAHDLADLLGQWGYEVVGIASSGEKAVQKAKETRPDLVLVDIKLQGEIDGVNVVELIRSTINPAVIYLTARTEVDLIQRAKVTEPYGYLSKPVAPAELQRTVEMALYKHQMERCLRESEKRFRAIFDQTYQFIGLMDKEGILIEANRSALEFYGLSESDVVGMPFWEAAWWSHSPEQQEKLRYAIQKAATGEFVRFEAVHPAPDGEIHYVDVSIKPVKDDAGEVILLIPEGRDITERKRAEDALHESEKRIRSLIDTMTEGFGTVDKDGFLTYVNDRLCHMLGYTHEELVGRRFSSLANRGSKPELVFQTELRKDGRPASYEIELVRKDEQLVNVIVSARPAFDQDGIFQGSFGVVTDITERKQTEKALEESERRYRSLVEASPDPIVLYDLTGNFISVNQQAAEVYGVVSPEQFLAEVKNIADLLSLSDRERAFGNFQETLRKGTSTKNEYSVRRNNGTVFPVEAHSSVMRGADGEPIGFVSVIRDITERKEAEQAVKESEATLRSLLQAAPIGIAQVSSERIFGWINQTLCHMLGYSEEEIRGQHVRIMYESEKEYDRASREIRPQLMECGIGNIETNLRRRDGKVIEVLLSVSSILPQDLSKGVVLTALDITERKRLEEQLFRSQKMQAVGTMAGGIAHDFNNLLQVIHGYADMALLALKEEQPGYTEMQHIKQASTSAAELTEGLLTFSRRVESKPRPTNVNREVEQVARMLNRTIPKHIEIDLQYGEDLYTVNCDPAQMHQMLINVAINARDAMPEGGMLTISTEKAYLDEEYCRLHLGTKPGRYVLLTIADTGCGMDKNTIAQIFDPFFTTKVSGKGTGLGLSIVFGIVKNHGGHIICYSELGHGSTFKIFLPAIQQVEDEEDEENEVSLIGGDETILIVDDELAVRNLAKDVLEKFGYTVFTAGDGREGLEMFMSHRENISLVILDLMMPKMGGRECMREILTLDPSARVLIASGYATNGQIEKTLEEGAIASLRKPYETHHLLGSVRRALDQPQMNFHQH